MVAQLGQGRYAAVEELLQAAGVLLHFLVIFLLCLDLVVKFNHFPVVRLLFNQKLFVQISHLHLLPHHHSDHVLKKSRHFTKRLIRWLPLFETIYALAPLSLFGGHGGLGACLWAWWCCGVLLLDSV